MSTQMGIFWPILAQIVLVFVIYLLVSSRRIAAIKAGSAKAADFKIPSIEPEASATAARNLSNQFELPVLFYVVCLCQFVTNGAGTLAIILAWLFVAARVAHAYVHVTSNRLILRRRLFIASVAVNMVQWIVFAIHII